MKRLVIIIALVIPLLLIACGGGGGGNFVYTYYSTDTPLPIPDQDTTFSDLVVTGAPAFISKVTVTVVIVHTWVADLELILWSPDNTPIYLTDNYSEGEDFWYTTFDDNAPIGIWQTTILDSPRTGSYQPDVPLAFLIGEHANGLWTLEVVDTVIDDFGYLVEWSIDIQ